MKSNIYFYLSDDLYKYTDNGELLNKSTKKKKTAAH